MRLTVPTSRYPGLTLRVLGADTPAIGPGKARLVDLIASTGSISAAARAMGMSYRRAWLLVAAMNESFREPVVIAETGGRSGGGARVTPFGRRLVERFHAMENKASAAIAADLQAFSRELKKTASQRSRARRV
jgi:molybdate transport system regulatory protein